MEAIVREEGATPATVGVIEGVVRVGLTSEQLDRLAQCQSSVKVSHRDLPYVLSKVWRTLTCNTNLTTCHFHQSRQGSNALLWFCSAFPGVRRCRPLWSRLSELASPCLSPEASGEFTEMERTVSRRDTRELLLITGQIFKILIFLAALDISADLTELGRTPIAVVSAGVKSILDIGRTLEFLVRLLENFPWPSLGFSPSFFKKKSEWSIFNRSTQSITNVRSHMVCFFY